eukprot:89300-Chlamydomonas_euryale.AAC.7
MFGARLVAVASGKWQLEGSQPHTHPHTVTPVIPHTLPRCSSLHLLPHALSRLISPLYESPFCETPFHKSPFYKTPFHEPPHPIAPRSFGSADVSLSLELYSVVPPGEAAPVQLHCESLSVPITACLRPPPPGAPPPPAAEFFRAWAALPARAELPAVCAWPGPEGQAAALSALLRAPLRLVLLQHLPAQAALQAAFTGTTLAGASLSLLLFTQLLPPAAGSGPECGAALGAVQLYVRSSSAEVVEAATLRAAAFLADVSGGTLLHGAGALPPRPGPGRPRPAIDDRVAALMRFDALAATPLDAKAPAAEQQAGADGGEGGEERKPPPALPTPPGPKVSRAWLRSTALAEWQRLACQPA